MPVLLIRFNWITLTITEYEETEAQQCWCPGWDWIPILLQHWGGDSENLGWVSKLNRLTPSPPLCPPRKRWSDQARHKWRNTPRHAECWLSQLCFWARAPGTRKTRWWTRSSWSLGWYTEHRLSLVLWRMSVFRGCQLPGISNHYHTSCLN